MSSSVRSMQCDMKAPGTSSPKSRCASVSRASCSRNSLMFETGRGNTETIALFGRAGVSADGGVTSNSLGVFVYERMPNGTDFTIPKARGVQGLNFAFIGRQFDYHSPTSTPAEASGHTTDSAAVSLPPRIFATRPGSSAQFRRGSRGCGR